MIKGNSILFLTLYTFDLTGGIEKVCKNLVDVFKDLSINCTIQGHQTLSLYDNKQNSQDYKAFGGNKIRFSVNAIRKGLKSNLIILSHIHLLVFAKLIRMFNPQKRIVLLAHGIEVWKPLSNWKKQFLSTIEIWAVSNYTAQQLQQINGVPSRQVKVLNNCLPKGFEFEEKIKSPNITKRYQIPVANKILLTTCRLSSSEKYKGYDLVLLALKDLVKIQPSLSYVIVGKGDDEEIERITQLISIYELQNHVFLTGYLTDDELKEFYQCADIFVMPSKGEGFGLVYIEAAAYGCQVIAGNADGSSDALLGGELGSLVDPDSCEEVYNALNNLIFQPYNKEVIRETQRKTMTNFGFNQYAYKVKALINSGAPSLTLKVGS